MSNFKPITTEEIIELLEQAATALRNAADGLDRLDPEGFRKEWGELATRLQGTANLLDPQWHKNWGTAFEKFQQYVKQEEKQEGR